MVVSDALLMSRETTSSSGSKSMTNAVKASHTSQQQQNKE